MTTQEKIIELEKIAEEIRAFKGLEIARQASNAVPGEGNPDARLFYVGEAPGAREDLTGRPFVGQAGQLWEKTQLEILGLKRSDIYITNVVKYRPPENRDPTDAEIAACRDWLDRQIQILKPQIIVTLGRFSMAKFIPGVTISRVHGQARFISFQPNAQMEAMKAILFPMYHPAAALRAGTVLKEFREDFVKLKNLLNPTPLSGVIGPLSGPTPTSLPRSTGQQTLF